MGVSDQWLDIRRTEIRERHSTLFLDAGLRGKSAHSLRKGQQEKKKEDAPQRVFVEK